MQKVTAEFDGCVFVPSEKVELPVGTRVEVLVPHGLQPPTEQETQEWREIVAEIRAQNAPFQTVDEALRYSRKRP